MKPTLRAPKRSQEPDDQLRVNGRELSGRLAVTLADGATSEERERAIEEALSEALSTAAERLGLVLSAAPERYGTPARSDGGAVVDVAAVIEGDLLIPARGARGRQKRR